MIYQGVFFLVQKCLQEVLNHWREHYKLWDMFDGKVNLFSYFAFPATRRSLDANNPTESLNKRLE